MAKFQIRHNKNLFLLIAAFFSDEKEMQCGHCNLNYKKKCSLAEWNKI